MEQTVFARKDLYESAKWHYALHCAVVNLTNLRNSHDSLDSCLGCLEVVLVGGSDLDHAAFLVFCDDDDGVSALLNLLNDFSARSDNGADEVLRNDDLLDTWHELFVVGTWLADGLRHLAEDVHPACLCLLESLAQHLV